MKPPCDTDKQKYQQQTGDLGGKDARQEQICRNQQRTKETTHEWIPTHGGSQLLRLGIVNRPTKWNRCEKLPGEQKRSQHHGHVLRSDTPASSNVAISVRILIAAKTRLIPRQAPVP